MSRGGRELVKEWESEKKNFRRQTSALRPRQALQEEALNTIMLKESVKEFVLV